MSKPKSVDGSRASALLSRPLPVLAKLTRTVQGRRSKWRKGLSVRVTSQTDEGLIVVERVHRVCTSKLMPDGLPLFNVLICEPSDVQPVEE